MSAPSGTVEAGRRSSMLAKIHIAKAELALEENSYRGILRRAAGKTSCAEMNEREMDAVLREFVRLGWSPNKKATPPPDWAPPSNKAYVRKIYALWWDYHRERHSSGGELKRRLTTFARRMTGIDNPEWLGPSSANKVIEGIKAMIKRRSAGKGE